MSHVEGIDGVKAYNRIVVPGRRCCVRYVAIESCDSGVHWTSSLEWMRITPSQTGIVC